MGDANGTRVTLRAGTAADLAAVNAVIERAVMGWDLPERVRRLSLPSYRYHAHDLATLALRVAQAPGAGIVGVAAWESADPRDAPPGRRALLLHGLYVDPGHQRRGIGRGLLRAAVDAARRGGYDGILVKAQPGAEGFFRDQGMARLPIENPDRDYPHRFWKDV